MPGPVSAKSARTDRNAGQFSGARVEESPDLVRIVFGQLRPLLSAGTDLVLHADSPGVVEVAKPPPLCDLVAGIVGDHIQGDELGVVIPPAVQERDPEAVRAGLFVGSSASSAACA